MRNKTISLPADVVPIIDRLDMPFSRWVAEQLRRYDARTAMTFADQLVADAALAQQDDSARPDRRDVGTRMARSAPW